MLITIQAFSRACATPRLHKFVGQTFEIETILRSAAILFLLSRRAFQAYRRPVPSDTRKLSIGGQEDPTGRSLAGRGIGNMYIIPLDGLLVLCCFSHFNHFQKQISDLIRAPH